MSRVGKRTIKIPQGVTISVTNNVLFVKGPKGELSRTLPEGFEIKINEDVANVDYSKKETKSGGALWGTFASHLMNMIKGVSEGFEKKLMINGVGYTAEVKGKDIVLNLGFSHSIVMQIPDELNIETKKGEITIKSHNKETLGQFASKIRLKKPAEPYKGHGIHYSDEYVIRKQGKKATT